MVKLKTLFFFISILLIKLSYAQQNVSGYVFFDKNNNSQKDFDEQGIPNVSISNGIEVIQTDFNGKYNISLKENQILFVIKPANFDLPLDEHKRPKFYYIHKPNGSPNLKYKGSKPTGKLPRTLNFPLNLSKKETDFSIIVFGDTQVNNLKEIEYLKNSIIKDAKNYKNIKFGITLGDLVNDNLKLLEPYSKVVSEINKPWFNVYGNHDMNLDAEHDDFADETFEATFGPTTFAFNQGNVHFIVLDNIEYPRKDEKEGYIGSFTPSQLQFIENDLKYVDNNKLLVLFFHIPLLLQYEDLPSMEDKFRKDDRKKLFDLLKDYPNTISFAAHRHYQHQKYFDYNDGWMQDKPHHQVILGTTCGDFWSGSIDSKNNNIPEATMRDGTPKGYAVVDFNDNKYTINYKVAGESESYKMKLYHPLKVRKAEWPNAALYVNFFMGDTYSKVFYQLNGGDWKSMKKVNEVDPSLNAERLKWEESTQLPIGNKPSLPINSSHLWKANLSVDKLGINNIKVKAIDYNGQVHFGKSEYEVIE